MTPLSVVFYFLLYSFIGWILDTGYRSWWAKTYTVGSFFPVPLCPVYGFGALGVLILHQFLEGMSMLGQWAIFGILLATLELVTGIWILTVYQKRLWHYQNTPLNVQGFTDAPHAIVWGVLGLLVVNAHPVLHEVIVQVIGK